MREECMRNAVMASLVLLAASSMAWAVGILDQPSVGGTAVPFNHYSSSGHVFGFDSGGYGLAEVWFRRLLLTFGFCSTVCAVAVGAPLVRGFAHSTRGLTDAAETIG